MKRTSTIDCLQNRVSADLLCDAQSLKLQTPNHRMQLLHQPKHMDSCVDNNSSGYVFPQDAVWWHTTLQSWTMISVWQSGDVDYDVSLTTTWWCVSKKSEEYLEIQTTSNFVEIEYEMIDYPG